MGSCPTGKVRLHRHTCDAENYYKYAASTNTFKSPCVGRKPANTFTDNGFKHGTDYNTEDGISTDTNNGNGTIYGAFCGNNISTKTENGNGTIYGAYCGKSISTKTEDGISTDSNNGTNTNYYGNDSDYGRNISNDTSTGCEETSP